MADIVGNVRQLPWNGVPEAARPRAPLPGASPLLRLSLSGRVLLVSALVGVLMIVLSAAALIDNARTAVALETADGQRLARDYAVATLAMLLREKDPETAVRLLPGVMTRPRHVGIVVVDGRDTATAVAERARDRARAPAWFAAMLEPAPREIVIPVRSAEGTFGRIVVTPHPADEIDEIFEDFQTLAVLAALAYAVGLASLGLLVRLTLRPLNRMAAAVDRLEAGDYAARIGATGVPELDGLARKFDGLGRALGAAFAERDALSRNLVDVQDAERKRIALELHDEFGPCLFGLRVEARAILAAAEAEGDRATADRARSIIGIVEEIQRGNRALLASLRPMELGELPLAQVLDDLVGQMVARGGDTLWSVAISDALGPYDETSELTIYRVAQEAMTNALRHAGAGRIAVAVGPLPDRPDIVEIVVEDDGRGLAGARAGGVGLKGMRERAAAVGGSFVARDRAAGGTIVRATVPVRPAPVEEGVAA